MKTELKDVIHLYMGCEVSVRNITHRYTKTIDLDFFRSYYDEYEGTYLNDPKLILRPLPSMTEEEAKEFRKMFSEMADADKAQGEIWADQTRHMLSKGFDLFGLIESGLAIDSTTQKVNA